jgi:hypothetical protein
MEPEQMSKKKVNLAFRWMKRGGAESNSVANDAKAKKN